MSHFTPRVYAHWLPVPTDDGPAIRLDSPAWFAWLAAPTTTRFAYPIYDRRCGYIVGCMTVRKEARQRGGSYWTVYRRVGAKLRKHYLGGSATVTQARLDAIAADLLAESSLRAGEPPDAPPRS